MFRDSQFIAIHGLSVHYRIVRPDGPVRHRVLLLSSPGQSAGGWQRIMPELTQAGCLCVLCDLPGFGLSECRDDAPQDQTTRAKFIWGLLDALDLDGGSQLYCWHLMAHGSACGTIAEMALQQPDSAASLFMLCPILYPPLPPLLMVPVKSPKFGRLISAYIKRLLKSEKRLAFLGARLYGAKLTGRQLAALKQTLSPLAEHGEMLRRALAEGYAMNTARLNDLFMPAMVLWGSRDPLLGDRIPDRLRRRDFRTAEYHILSGCGHYPAETHSRAVCDFLRGWIREIW